MTKEVLNVVSTYVGQLVEVLTPIAKQAYETGLMVITIDGLGVLAPALLAFIVSAYFMRDFLKKIAEYRDMAVAWNNSEEGSRRYPKGFHDYAPFDGVPLVLQGIVSTAILLPTLCVLSNIWLWIKVFAPQLWLAHMAIEKIMGK